MCVPPNIPKKETKCLSFKQIWLAEVLSVSHILIMIHSHTVLLLSRYRKYGNKNHIVYPVQLI
jgi:hypothetical protein